MTLSFRCQQPSNFAVIDDRLESESARVVIDATGPPVLNQAAAEVLLRILLRADKRHGMTNAAYSATLPLPSDL